MSYKIAQLTLLTALSINMFSDCASAQWDADASVSERGALSLGEEPRPPLMLDISKEAQFSLWRLPNDSHPSPERYLSWVSRCRTSIPEFPSKQAATDVVVDSIEHELFPLKPGAALVVFRGKLKPSCNLKLLAILKDAFPIATQRDGKHIPVYSTLGMIQVGECNEPSEFVVVIRLERKAEDVIISFSRSDHRPLSASMGKKSTGYVVIPIDRKALIDKLANRH